MTTLVLTGFMGVGKSTVGKIVARRCGLPFVDLDDEIERRSGRRVTDIFALEGEEAFRQQESTLLDEVLQWDDAVIATGGGALLSEANRALLRPDHTVICLWTDVEELKRRLNGATDRPVLQGGVSLETLLAARTPVYSLFPQLETGGRSPDDVANEIIERTGLSVVGRIETDRAFTTDILVEEAAAPRLAPLLRSASAGRAICIVADERVRDLGHVSTVVRPLEAEGFSVTVMTVTPGEQHKTLTTLQGLYTSCLDAGLDRSATVLAVGGGVVCDLAGMLAATYLRGLRYVALPTTLLAAVDAAIGGKVGVDLDGVKNIVGAFYPAHAVVVDPELLGTLPPALLGDGAAEIIKIAVVRSQRLLCLLHGVTDANELPSRLDIIRLAASCKVQVVSRDPFERGERMMLNYGHTVGHAIETASDYRLSHGCAVSLGMAAETRFAVEKGICPPQVLERLLEMLHRFDLPASLDSAHDVTLDRVTALMQHDKKRAGTMLRFALPTGMGTGEVFTLEHGEACRAAELAWRERT